MQARTRKVVLLGNSQSGKTKALKELLGTSTANNVYKPTLGVAPHTARIGGKQYSIWDTAGQDRYGGLRDGYYVQADIVVIFTGGNPNLSTHKTPVQWGIDAKRVSPNASFWQISNGSSSALRHLLANI